MTDYSNSIEINNLSKQKDLSTPCIVLFLEEIKRNYFQFRELLDLDEVFYSIKANNHPRILKMLHDLGSSFEIGNEHELKYLLNLGFDTNRILFSPLYLPSDLKAIFEYVKGIVINSESFLEKVICETKNLKLLQLRIHFPGNDDALHSSTTGLMPDKASHVIQKYGMKNIGLGMHVGSGCNFSNIYLKHLNSLNSLKNTLNCDVSTINLGGGFINNDLPFPGTHMMDFDLIKKNISRNFRNCYRIAEPGRFIVSNAGYFIVKVIDCFNIKNTNYLRVDAGIYNGLLDIGLINKKIEIRSNKKGTLREYNVIGPTNDGKDIIGSNILLPDQERGDLLIIPNSGAYSSVLSTHFCQLCQPQIIIIA